MSTVRGPPTGLFGGREDVSATAESLILSEASAERREHYRRALRTMTEVLEATLRDDRWVSAPSGSDQRVIQSGDKAIQVAAQDPRLKEFFSFPEGRPPAPLNFHYEVLLYAALDSADRRVAEMTSFEGPGAQNPADVPGRALPRTASVLHQGVNPLATGSHVPAAIVQPPAPPPLAGLTQDMFMQPRKRTLPAAPALVAATSAAAPAADPLLSHLLGGEAGAGEGVSGGEAPDGAVGGSSPRKGVATTESIGVGDGVIAETRDAECGPGPELEARRRMLVWSTQSMAFVLPNRREAAIALRDFAKDELPPAPVPTVPAASPPLATIRRPSSVAPSVANSKPADDAPHGENKEGAKEEEPTNVAPDDGPALSKGYQPVSLADLRSVNEAFVSNLRKAMEGQALSQMDFLGNAPLSRSMYTTGEENPSEVPVDGIAALKGGSLGLNRGVHAGAAGIAAVRGLDASKPNLAQQAAAAQLTGAGFARALGGGRASQDGMAGAAKSLGGFTEGGKPPAGLSPDGPIRRHGFLTDGDFRADPEAAKLVARMDQKQLYNALSACFDTLTKDSVARVKRLNPTSPDVVSSMYAALVTSVNAAFEEASVKEPHHLEDAKVNGMSKGHWRTGLDRIMKLPEAAGEVYLREQLSVVLRYKVDKDADRGCTAADCAIM